MMTKRRRPLCKIIFFFFNDTATTEIYTLSLHDALPIWRQDARSWKDVNGGGSAARNARTDRKSTRLNSSHSQISYAVFCLKKKKQQQRYHRRCSTTENSKCSTRSPAACR